MSTLKRRGYLMIELMIALVLVSFTGLVIGQLSGYVSTWHRDASLYLKAATLATSAVNASNVLPNSEGIYVTRKTSRPFQNTPFELIEVSITILLQNEKRVFTFAGGRVAREAS